MGITKRDLELAAEKYSGQYGGSKDDHFALLYLSREFEKDSDQLARHVAFGDETPEGINAFHVDVNRRNLYLFRFEWSQQHQTLKEPLRRLAREGMERIFGPQPANAGPLLAELRSRLHEDQAAIDKVIVQFIYNGEPADADQSAALDALREDLEAKKYLIDQFFQGRSVTLTFQFVSNEIRSRVSDRLTTTHRYELSLKNRIKTETGTGERLEVGFVRVIDLYGMFHEMRQRLFERNIRAGLNPDGPINKKIRAALSDIVEGKAPASAFVFNHNGITVAAESLEVDDETGLAHVTEPRVLNGAQTITSLAHYVEDGDDKRAQEVAAKLEDVRVLAKFVTRAPQPFITGVTINTNRQNPVEPANLRASDDIQLDLQDRFRDEMKGMLYERQEKLFASLSDEEMLEQGYDPNWNKAVEIKRLAKTFLAAQGEIDRMSRLNEVFENEAHYRSCFAERYLKSDLSRILLAYKIQFRLNRVAREIDDTARGYWYVPRAKNLLWALLVQGVLNHSKVEAWTEAYGRTLTVEADYTQELLGLGVQKVRHVIREAAAEKKYKEQLDDDRLSFLRGKAFYGKCMEVAADRYGWNKKAL